jgi:hypothetical protein
MEDYKMNTIADAKELFFEDKEHYLAFRKAWKEAANNPHIHLDAHHFMFYSAIRGRNCFEGFRNKTPRKAYTQGWANPGTSNAYTQLKYIARGGGKGLCHTFGDTISPQVVVDVISMIPKVSPEYTFTNKPYEEWKLDYLLKHAPVINDVEELPLLKEAS